MNPYKYPKLLQSLKVSQNEPKTKMTYLFHLIRWLITDKLDRRLTTLILDFISGINMSINFNDWR